MFGSANVGQGHVHLERTHFVHICLTGRVGATLVLSLSRRCGSVADGMLPQWALPFLGS